jgi:hypothetical protein
MRADRQVTFNYRLSFGLTALSGLKRKSSLRTKADKRPANYSEAVLLQHIILMEANAEMQGCLMQA